MANLIKNYNLMSFGQSFARLNGQPLDDSSIYYSLADAQAYALTAKAYAGQPVAVVDEIAGKAILYVVNPDSTLEQVGVVPVGDGKTVAFDNNTIALHNWGKEYFKWIDANGDDPEAEDYVAGHYEKHVLAEGEAWPSGLEPKATTDDNGTVVLGWYEASNQTSQQISNTVGMLQGKVDTLGDLIGNAEQPLDGTIYGELKTIKEDTLSLSKGGTVEADLAVTGSLTIVEDEKHLKVATEDFVLQQIAEADHLKRKIVDALPEVDAEGVDENTIYMIKDDNSFGDKYIEYMLINGVFEQIGDTSVDLTNYVQKVEGATVGNIVGFGENGALVDSKLTYASVAEHIEDTDLHIQENERSAWNTGASNAATALDTANANAALITKLNLGNESLTADHFTKLIDLPTITTIGANLNLTDGVLSAVAEQYELPTASADTLGGVKVGDGLAITEEGVLSINVSENANGIEIVNGKLALTVASSTSDGILTSAAYEKFDKAQENVIESISLAGLVEATIDESKQVIIPLANKDGSGNPGLVVSTDNEDAYNTVRVENDGTMRVNKINVANLVVPENVELILNGGSAE